MTRTEAEEWCADSAIVIPVHDVTTRTAVVAISQHGFDLSFRAGGRMWGDGVYMTVDAEVRRWYLGQVGDRDIALELRVDVRRVLSVQVRPSRTLPMFQVLAAIPEGLARFVMATASGRDRAAALTHLLIEAGYDALEILEDPFTPVVGGNQLVVFDPQRIVVVSDDDTEQP